MTNVLCEFCNNNLDLKRYHFLCNNCGKLIHLPDNLDYFTYLNIDLSYPIDKDLLEKQYIKLFALYHPDNFINASNKEQLNSIIHSSYLNQAYSSLKDNTKLVQYLYELKTCDKLDLYKDNNNNVVYYFELNEELEQIVDEKQKYKFKQKLQNIYDKLVSEINEAFNNKNYIKIKEELFNQLKYINNIMYKLQ